MLFQKIQTFRNTDVLQSNNAETLIYTVSLLFKPSGFFYTFLTFLLLVFFHLDRVIIFPFFFSKAGGRLFMQYQNRKKDRRYSRYIIFSFYYAERSLEQQIKNEINLSGF